jgi:hypothetical protein
MRLDGAPERALGGEAHRVRRDGQRRDAEPLEMRSPSRVVREDALGMVCQERNHRPGQGALAHVGQRLGVDDVVGMPGPQQFEEVQPALAGRGAEPGEIVVADLRATAVRCPVPRPGVVHRDPASACQPGPQHIAALVEEALLIEDQQAHDLPLGDGDPHRPQLRDQARHGRLTLVVLGQHIAPKLGPEVAIHPARQRRHDQLPLWRQPALTAVADGLGAQHQILDQEILVALEPRAGRCRGLDDLVLDGHARHHLAAAAALVRVTGGLRLAGPLHPARFQLGAAFQAFEPRDLLALRRYGALQLRHLAQQLDDQRLQFGRREGIEVSGRGHPRSGSEPTASGKRNPLGRHGFCPSYASTPARTSSRPTSWPPSTSRQLSAIGHESGP